mmetsp:Transcript_15058/g.17309  ORF Transcript_15058/g.17309 Transcript_15058/m.17309 type:complete len:200 (-) Transcript_15058:823-1422(-)
MDLTSCSWEMMVDRVSVCSKLDKTDNHRLCTLILLSILLADSRVECLFLTMPLWNATEKLWWLYLPIVITMLPSLIWIQIHHKLRNCLLRLLLSQQEVLLVLLSGLSILIMFGYQVLMLMKYTLLKFQMETLGKPVSITLFWRPHQIWSMSRTIKQKHMRISLRNILTRILKPILLRIQMRLMKILESSVVCAFLVRTL